MKTLRILKTLSSVTLSALILSSGCVAYHSGTAKIIDPYPPKYFSGKKGSAKSVAVVAHVTADPGGPGTGMLIDNTKEYIQDSAEDVFEDSKVYRYSADSKKADYIIMIEAKNKMWNNACCALVSGFSLFLLPMITTDSYNIKCKVISRSGKHIGEYSFKSKQTNIYELLMILGMPFASTGTVEKRLWRNIIRDVSVRMYNNTH